MPMGAPSLLGQRQVRQAQVCPGSPDSAEGPISPGAVEGRWGGGRPPCLWGGRAVGTRPGWQRPSPRGSMRVDAKLIRVINSAAPQRGPTRVSATNW